MTNNNNNYNNMVKTVAVIILFAHILDCFFCYFDRSLFKRKKNDSKSLATFLQLRFLLNVRYVNEIEINGGVVLMRFGSLFRFT